MHTFNIGQYLRRIGISHQPSCTDADLALLHRQHVLHVPFENLDIFYKKPFTLEPDAVFKKIVLEIRGGYCYELNLLFGKLLSAIGFSVKFISARIVNEDGTLGPPFDHLCLYVQTTRPYLADVGYGDLFLTPIEICDRVQTDGRNHFAITNHPEGKCLSMSSDGVHFQKRYVFSTNEVDLSDFNSISLEKQTHPDSYFVKNLVCTKPTTDGRITIFNDKIIERTSSVKIETKIDNDKRLREHLKNIYHIHIDS